MLFERFVFVMYILFSYSWFLLGTIYDTSFRYVPIIALILSLCSIIVVTLFQLQKITRRELLSESDRWSTIVWCIVHIILSICLIADAFELTNVLVIVCIMAIVITIALTTVAICACYVIMLDSDDYRPHVHLSCICFWMSIQYMALRLPIVEFKYVTTIPVVLMWILRLSKHFEDGILYKDSIVENFLFLIITLLHLFSNIGILNAPMFYWGIVTTVCAIIFIGHHVRELLTVIILPIFLLILVIYLCINRLRGISTYRNIKKITDIYDEMTSVELELNLPFEEDENEYDWTEPL